MKNNQKVFVAILIVVIAIGGYFVLKTKQRPVVQQVPVISTDETTNWKTYSNRAYEFKYPPDWKISYEYIGSNQVSIDKNDGSKFPDSISIQNSIWSDQPIFSSLEKSVDYVKENLPGVLIRNVKEITLNNGKAFYSDNYQENPGVNNSVPPAAVLVSQNSSYYLAFLPVFYNDPAKDPKEQADEKLILKVIATFKFTK